MKAIIQKLIEELSALPVPKDPEQVQKKFEMFPELFTAPTTNDVELSCVQQLLVVKQLVDAGIEVNKLCADLQLHAEEFVCYQTQEGVLHNELQELNERRSLSNQAVTTYREEITVKYQQFLIDTAQDDIEQLVGFPLGADLTKLQASRIKTIQNALKDGIYRLELPIKKLRLLELKQEKNTLLAELYNLSEFHSLNLHKPYVENAELFTSTKASLEQRLQKILELKPKIDVLQKKFSECFSSIDAEKKSKELLVIKAGIGKELDALNLEIEAYCIDESIRNRLITEFSQSPNKAVLIKSYSDKVSLLLSAFDTVLSYDPTSLFTRVAGYKPQHDESSIATQFLTLLNKQKDKLEEEHNLSLQLEALAQISNSTAHSTEQKDIFIEQTRLLLNALPDCKIPPAFSADASATDYYLLILNNIVLLPSRIKHHKVVIEFLGKLLAVLTELEALREQFKLRENQDYLLSSIEELKTAIPCGVQTLLSKKREHLELCNQFIAQFMALVKNLKSEEKIKTDVDSQIDEITFSLTVLRKALEKKRALQSELTFEQQIAALSLKRSTLQQDLGDKIDFINLKMQQQSLGGTSTVLTTAVSAATSESTTQSTGLTEIVVQKADSESKLKLEVTALSDTGTVTLSQGSTDVLQQVSGQSTATVVDTVTTELSAAAAQLAHVDTMDKVETEYVERASLEVITNVNAQLDTVLALSSTANQHKHAEVTSDPTGLSAQEVILAYEAQLKVASVTHVTSSTAEAHGVTKQSDKSAMSSMAGDSVTSDAKAIDATKQSDKSAMSSMAGDSVTSDAKAIDATKQSDKSAISSMVGGSVTSDATTIDATKQSDKSVIRSMVDNSVTSDATTIDATKQSELSIITTTTSCDTAAQVVATGLSQAITGHDPQVQSAAPIKVQQSQIHHALHIETDPALAQKPPSLAQLDDWHQKNCAELNHYSNEVKTWYLNLFAVVELAAQQAPNSYKYLQLIRDVSFALSNKSETINYYMALCPNPKDNCATLLAFKPNAPIEDTKTMTESELALLPVPFQKLYEHQQQLKANPRFLIEAELLQQAMHSLLCIYRAKSHMLATEMPQINQDPRYEPLKRHRGLLRAWELIEDFCRLIVGILIGQEESKYHQRPSLFKTRSQQLLEKAELLVHEQTSTTVPT